MEKSSDSLRKTNRALRAGLSQQAQVSAAAALCERLYALTEYQQAQRVAVYFAVRGEISLAPLIDQALAAGKQLYLPNLDQQALRFAPYFHQQVMRLNRFKLPEPDVPAEQLLAPAALDLVFAPLVAFDSALNRIGMGGGFYDRSFAFRKNPNNRVPLLVGVAHELQKVESLTPEDWDVPLDMVATDRHLYL